MKGKFKQEWVKAEAEVVKFDNEDIITQSGISTESGIIDLPDIPTH